MSWAKLDDGMWSHPKFLALSNGAIGVWTKALSWSAQQLRNGALPRGLVDFLRATELEVSELVEAGLWEVTADGWQIHDYLDFNPDRDSVLSERAKGKERARRSNERRKERSESSPEASPDLRRSFAVSSGDPSRPVPTPENSNQIATAETDTSVRDTPKRILASKGRHRLRAVAELELDFDHAGKCEHALSVIAHLPAKEWAAAAAALKSEVDKGNRRLITPQSIVDNWHHWRVGEVPGQRKPITAAKPAEPQRYRVIANGGA